MDVTVTIKADDIYNKVYAVTGHTGKVLEKIDTMSATEDESNVLEPLLSESVAELSDVVSSYGSVENVGDVTVNFVLPSNWKDSAKNSLTKAIESFLVNGVCSKWFAITNREDVKYYADKQTVSGSNIIKLLCERTRPNR